jgi:DNA-binding transcriptional MerR regulator
MENVPKYTAHDLSRLFNVSQQTIRQWSSEFETYLSARANPGSNRIRAYSDEDAAVLALVAQMKEMGHVFQDIHIALANGQRGEVPDLKESNAQRSEIESRFSQLQLSANAEVALANQRAEAALARAAELETRIEQTEQQRAYWQERATEAERKLHEMEVNLARMEGEATSVNRDRETLERQREHIDRLESERSRLSEELIGIYRRLASLQNLLDGAESRSNPSTDDAPDT